MSEGDDVDYASEGSEANYESDDNGDLEEDESVWEKLQTGAEMKLRERRVSSPNERTPMQLRRRRVRDAALSSSSSDETGADSEDEDDIPLPPSRRKDRRESARPPAFDG